MKPLAAARAKSPTGDGRSAEAAVASPKARKAPAKSLRSAPAAAGPAPQARPRRPRAPRVRAEQPLGVGVADAFALERLRGPASPESSSRASRGGVREIGWAEFGTLARDLATRIGESWTPDVVLAVANAGVFVGGALAPVFGAELVHLHLPGRGRAERLPRFAGKKVLVVDDAANSGKTLAAAVSAARNARAAEVRSAVLALRPGGARPDWCALETSDVVVFGWDYQFHAGGPDVDPGDWGV